MKLRDQLTHTTDRYCELTGMSRSRLSTIILSGGTRIQRIAEGGDVSTGTFERAMQWLSDNWPDGGRWPDGVPRPVPQRGEPGGACGAVCAPEMGAR